MTAGFNANPEDVNNVPIAAVYPPGSSGNMVALQGSTLTNTDAKGNTSSPANFNLTQINSLAAQMAGSDGVTASNALLLAHALYNGATLDQQRGNQDNITLLNLSGVTTSQLSNIQINYNARMLYVCANVTTLTGTSPTLTPVMFGVAPVAAHTFQIGATPTAISTTGVYVYLYGISAPTAAGGVTATIAYPIPREWKFQMTAGGTITNATYTVEAMYIV